MPSGNPAVTIIVPCYNAGQHVAETVESALAQTWTRIEIIAVDDGSLDDTAAVLKRFSARGVRVLSQDNAGQCAAINAALRHATGDYFQFLDADDLLHPRKIEVQLERLARTDGRAVATGSWKRFVRTATERGFVPDRVWRDLDPVDWLVTSWNGGGMMHVASWLIPRVVSEKAGPWNASLRYASMGLDADYFTRAILASSGCLYCKEAESYYRSVSGSQSSLLSRRSMVASLRVAMRTGEALLRARDDEETRMAYANNVQRFVYASYPENPDLVSIAERRITSLGGSNSPFTAGPVTQLAARCMGWKRAKKLRLTAQKLR